MNAFDAWLMDVEADSHFPGTAAFVEGLFTACFPLSMLKKCPLWFSKEVAASFTGNNGSAFISALSQIYDSTLFLIDFDMFVCTSLLKM